MRHSAALRRVLLDCGGYSLIVRQQYRLCLSALGGWVCLTVTFCCLGMVLARKCGSMLCAVVLPDCGATLAWHTAGDCYRIFLFLPVGATVLG